jgi:hypothetical protein
MFPAANPKVTSTASFQTDVFTFDPLYASEVISRSAQISGFTAGSTVNRGTVLFGVAPGLPQTAAYTNTGTQARAILAQTVVMPATGPANVVVYTQGKFLESGMTFSANGPNADAAQLWEFGIYVLSVMDRTGLLTPIAAAAQEEGPLHMTDEARKKALQDAIDAIKAAGPIPPPAPPAKQEPAPQPAWAEVAFPNPDSPTQT